MLEHFIPVSLQLVCQDFLQEADQPGSISIVHETVVVHPKHLIKHTSEYGRRHTSNRNSMTWNIGETRLAWRNSV